MADSFTTFLQIRLPATGAYNNTWGSTLNSDALQLLDTAITGWTTQSIGTSTAFSLPALSPGAASVSRYFSLLMTGTPAGPAIITVPSSVPGKMYLINNQTGQTLTFTYTGSSNTTTVAAGEIRLIWCDGTNCWAVVTNANSAAALNGIPAANWVRQSRTATEISNSTTVRNSITVPTAYPYFTFSDAPTMTIDCLNGNAQQTTLTGNRVFAIPANPADGSELDLLVIQDGTGGRTLSWNAVFLFENGTPPTLATAAGAMDRFLMKYNAGLAKWTVIHGQNINAGSGTTLPITIASNCLDWSLKALIGTLGAPATINILVAAGVIVEASTPGTPAIDLSGLISGCTVNLVNLGYIQGRGGKGGNGASASYPGSGGTILSAGPGHAGGRAILGPGSGCTFNITNVNGFIWGGGGGGGGGGAFDGNPTLGAGNGGGGGGGAGGGAGGDGGRSSFISSGPPQIGTDGGDGTLGFSGTFGTAGTGTNQGGANIGAAGAGGDWGAVGAAGTAAAGVVTGHFGSPGAGGAAGKAIELSGGAVTFVSGSGAPNVKGVVS